MVRICIRQGGPDPREAEASKAQRFQEALGNILVFYHLSRGDLTVIRFMLGLGKHGVTFELVFRGIAAQCLFPRPDDMGYLLATPGRPWKRQPGQTKIPVTLLIMNELGVIDGSEEKAAVQPSSGGRFWDRCVLILAFEGLADEIIGRVSSSGHDYSPFTDARPALWGSGSCARFLPT